ncbi:DUF4468 domain-containing protein [Mucilaginibacter myungsuensis]|uniref:DUF4468 domain-containing protein n=1 Tax=Mucilaginibacter myungsuensis TaxID=649104 RepID=A0A929KRV8_9SPHI|nr:DUF4468 domain-containing protein [Mucilaginibacter myungsuensis]MBE9660369.1 DUF4468 domain-containing protein [Mucilaginibacter myungsuensis]MDN3600411.1 DUF4468 domain-containing protein [Mucilaginibacter myungsuensis]
MKKILIAIAVLLSGKIASAQKELVTLDEHNKYIFYKVSETPGLPGDTLYNRLLRGLNQSKRFGKLKMDTKAGNNIAIKSSFLIYTSANLAKHEAGEVNYTLNAEVKEGKYRYWLTDFVFYPYERTRYGVYAKKPGVDYTFEQLKAKVGEREFSIYLDQIAKLGIEIGEQMTFYTADPEKKATEPVKVDTKKW